MQFPKPIGYYSIDLPEDVVNQIQELHEHDLKGLLCDITYKLIDGNEPFGNHCLGAVSNEVINDQLTCTNDWLGFMQWVLDGLKQAHN